MMRLSGNVPSQTIIWFASVFFVFIAVLGVYNVTLAFWYGTCWSSSKTELKDFVDEVQTSVRPHGDPKTFEINLGNCMTGVIFMNDDYKDTYADLFNSECGSYEYDAYMIAIPFEYFGIMDRDDLPDDLKGSVRDLKGLISNWVKVKIWIKDQVGKVPPSYCKGFEHTLVPPQSGSTVLPGIVLSIPYGFEGDWYGNRNLGGKYCITAAAAPVGDGDYRFSLTHAACPQSDNS